MLRPPAFLRSLSARLLVLTAFFVMLGEVLIFAPSVARYRIDYLEDRIAAAHLAILAVETAPGRTVDQARANELLAHVGARGVMLHKPDGMNLMIDSDMPPTVDATFDLRRMTPFGAIRDALAALVRADDRVLRVLQASPRDPAVLVELLLQERPLRESMQEFGRRLLGFSIVLSLLAAALVFVSLHLLLVRPMRRITASMMAFRADPENAASVIQPGSRSDEIGMAERELAVMQETVRQALRQRARLAALGTAVTKVNHDLRNILSTARLQSDSLAASDAPEVQRAMPRLLEAIDRAVELCARTLTYTRGDAPTLRLSRFTVADLVADVGRALERHPAAAPTAMAAAAVTAGIAAGPAKPAGAGVALRSEVPPDLAITADRDQFFRALLNLCTNAVEAGAQTVSVAAWLKEDGEMRGAVEILVADDGPGLPPKARENLFRPFAGSARPGGTGLGLAIAREVLRAHGGDIALLESTGRGTVFRLSLPPRMPR
ncbi:MAG TPA: HAMP domain-containing sensor histidine kinase [Stellaceae bacterium]|jgi:signal transduction histidine kinase